EQAAIRSKGQTVGVLLPACPEQSATLHVPQFDGVIPTPADQKPSIRAEGERVHDRTMSLPDPVERLAFLFPNTHFPLLAPRSPPPSRRCYGHNPGGIDSLGQDRVADKYLRERGILHLDALQICPTNTEMGEIQSVQVST